MEKDFSLVRKEEEEEEDNKNEKSSEETCYLSSEMMKKVSSMAAPMVAVSVSQYLLQVISMIMAGHVDELSLSAVAIATSLTNVTGFSLLFGLAGALETLCGQAFGAEQFRKIGAYTYSSMICLLFFCFPISLLWVFMDKLLLLFHQDPLISQLACRYSFWLIPALFGFSLLQSLTRYFQSQGLVLPLFLSSLDSALHREMKNLGWQEILSSSKQFIALAIPSAMMTCLEWWSFEILLLLSGLLPNSKLETSVISICLTMSAIHYVLVNAIGAAASTYVSNELGAGNPRAARAAANSAIFLGGVDAIVASITLYSYRRSWGNIFSNEREVADYATQITPIVCLSIFINSFLAVLSGVARGAGWQHIGGYASVGSSYLVGIPLGSILCFVVKLRGKGLRIGIVIASTLQLFVFALVTFFTNWEQEATKVRDRVFELTPQHKDNQETENILKEEDAQVLLKDISEAV